jgi:hypothetical protein
MTPEGAKFTVPSGLTGLVQRRLDRAGTDPSSLLAGTTTTTFAVLTVGGRLFIRCTGSVALRNAWVS